MLIPSIILISDLQELSIWKIFRFQSKIKLYNAPFTRLLEYSEMLVGPFLSSLQSQLLLLVGLVKSLLNCSPFNSFTKSVMRRDLNPLAIFKLSDSFMVLAQTKCTKSFSPKEVSSLSMTLICFISFSRSIKTRNKNKKPST